MSIGQNNDHTHPPGPGITHPGPVFSLAAQGLSQNMEKRPSRERPRAKKTAPGEKSY